MDCWDWYCAETDWYCVTAEFGEVGLAAGACGVSMPLGFVAGFWPGVLAALLCSASIATLADNGDCCAVWGWYYYDC